MILPDPEPLPPKDEKDFDAEVDSEKEYSFDTSSEGECVSVFIPTAHADEVARHKKVTTRTTTVFIAYNDSNGIALERKRVSCDLKKDENEVAAECASFVGWSIDVRKGVEKTSSLLDLRARHDFFL